MRIYGQFRCDNKALILRSISIRYLSIILLFFVGLMTTDAQEEATLPQVGDTPVANRITVTADEDDPTIAIITGEVGAVFPNAFVVVQNLYTNDRETSGTSSNGEFTIRLYGRHQTPYWVAAFERFPSDNDIDNAIGTIIYGEGDDKTFYVESDLGGNVPRYRIIGAYDALLVDEENPLNLQLNVEMDVADENVSFDDMRFSGEIYLLPITSRSIRRRDYQWGTVTTSESIPILGIRSEPIWLAEASTAFLRRTESSIQFGLNFNATLPDDLPKARYQPLFVGYVQIGDGEREPWDNSLVLGTHSDSGLDEMVDLPIWFSNQTAFPESLIWSTLSDQELQTDAGAFITPIYTRNLNLLSPDTYSLEPLWIDSLSLPIADGQLAVGISRPDGTHEVFDADVIQVERLLNSDRITLATNLDELDSYPFTDFGDYRIDLSGRLRIGDHVYFTQFDSTSYHVRIAEPLHVLPSMLAGTPLEVGDTLPLSLHLMPQLPADVKVKITFTPLVGEGITIEQEGQANESGYYVGEPIVVEQAGSYVINYQASYVDAEGRLWSGQLLTLGAMAHADNALILHGQRGVAGYDGVGQAWFDTAIYPADDINATQQPYYPYYSGDVAYIPDANESGIYPQLTVQTPENDSLELAYPDLSYITATRPDVILRQYVSGGDDPAAAFNGADTFDQQIGAGIDGIRDGDYAFLFGGVLTEDDSGIYSSLAIVGEDDESARVLSPFIDQLTIYGQTVDMFFVPTGVRPAQVMTLNDRLSIIGQVAPTLPADVTVSITSPSGQRTQFSDVANTVGYFYSPQNDLILDEIGIWTTSIQTIYRGETSLGEVEPPYPQGQLSYAIYVVPENNPPLGEAEFATETSAITKTYALNIPEGWTDVRAFATITTPSAILLQDELTVFPSGTSFTYNPTVLSREFPNIELLETADGNHVADVLTLTLAMTGMDAEGDFAIRTRTYSITHDTTYTFDDKVLR